jgi:hypothetical protein
MTDWFKSQREAYEAGRREGLCDATAACERQCRVWREANPDVVLTEYEAVADTLIAQIRALKGTADER